MAMATTVVALSKLAEYSTAVSTILSSYIEIFFPSEHLFKLTVDDAYVLTRLYCSGLIHRQMAFLMEI